MPHLHRFYVPPELLRGDAISLPEEEAHHATRVVRLQRGEQVALFDGAGREVTGPVVEIDKRRVVVAVEATREEPVPAARLTLLQAWLKRDKHIDEIIRHGTELGLGRFLFFRARHSEKTPERDPKWDRLAMESCKQSGRLWLPRFEVAGDLAGALVEPHETLLVATHDLPPVPLREVVCGRDVAVTVGPEGDFAEEELEMLRAHGARAVSLGEQTFRSEVAAIVACTLTAYEMGLLGPQPA